MKIKLNNELINSVKKGNCKASEVVQFLLNSGFCSEKSAFFSSLSDLKIGDKQIKKVNIDTYSNFINIYFKLNYHV
jgi:hypothetical protein